MHQVTCYYCHLLLAVPLGLRGSLPTTVLAKSTSQLGICSVPASQLITLDTQKMTVGLCPGTCAGAAVDSWDRMRDGAVSCLMKLPATLPGLETPPALLPHLRWACQLLRSPRVRESDAGMICDQLH